MSISSRTADVKPSHDLELIRLPPPEITPSISKDFSTDSVNGQGGFRIGNYQLPDGGSYSGTLLGNMAEGSGRYSWADGSVYTGGWRRGMRHGNGKISWPSGSSYDGEFSGGYIHGTGTYSGLNGMSYTGRWKLNLKHGLGRQKFSNRDTFEGSWMQGVIEGQGKYSWATGNVFIGNMKGGKMSGKGTLSLMNGDEYEGNWFNGMMHGFGVYTWSMGGFYVGTWTGGLKDGKGTFYPKNCRLPAVQELYINALRKRGLLPTLKRSNNGKMIRNSATDMSFDRKVRNTTKMGESSTRTSTSTAGMFSDYRQGNLVDYEYSQDQDFSLERRWSVEVAIEKAIAQDLISSMEDCSPVLENNQKFQQDIVMDAAPIVEREYMQGILISELVVNNKFFSSKRRKKLEKKLVKEIKRPGETIIKGHRSYDLMLSLQLGIRYTVGKITPIQRREVRASDFGPRASFWMNFPKEGSQLTPSHYADDFKWKDYCPMVFRNLREMFKIDAADYMMSICGSTALRQLSSPGKSGSVFFLSQDDRFMIKTLRRSEVKVLLRMLPNYFHHVHKYENTLITKFFGLHRVKPSSGQKFQFVVMGNMFCTELRIHRRFDLKGSSLGRSSDNVEIDENTTLKDLDLNYAYYLEPSWREELLKQIEIDSKFLETQRIMDYSMLLGVHYRAPPHLRRCVTTETLSAVAEEDVTEEETETPYPQGLVLVPRGRGCNENSVVVGSHIRGGRLRASAVGDEEVDLLVPDTARLQILLAVNMPARAEHIPTTTQDEASTLFHEVYDVVLYLGMIDILQEYDMKKKIEHACKSIQFDSLSISAVDPTFYSSRFLDFIRKVFPENN